MAANRDTEKTELIAAKAAEWRDRLVDLSYRNNLLYFQNTKLGSLDLTEAEPAALAELEVGTATSLRMLFPNTERHRDACGRARGLCRRINLLVEEQGIDVGRAAFGFIRTSPTQRSGSTPVPTLRAPILLRAMTLKARTSSESDYSLEFDDDPPELNPILLYALDSQYGIDVQRIEGRLADIVGSITDRKSLEEHVFGELAAAAKLQGIELQYESAVVLGAFSYEKLAMVQDLANSTQLLADNDIVAALAGYLPAREALALDAVGYEPRDIDEVSPADEFLVHDADSSQHRAVLAALAGRNVLIEGPPGTGKSQTIANIIAGAAACGKKVLFVAEKRAAIDAVKNRLIKVGLGGLMLDLHQDHASRRDLAKQLAERLDQAGMEPPVAVDELHVRLVSARHHVVAHSRELHARRRPWDVTAYDVRARLLELPDLEIAATFRGEQLRTLAADVVRQLEHDLKEFVFLDGLKILRQETPWCHTDIRTEQQVEAVLAELDQLADRTLQKSQQDMDLLLDRTGLCKPDDVIGWHDVLELLDEVSSSVGAFGADIYSDQLETYHLATGDRKQRKQIAPERRLGWLQRRRLIKELRVMTGGKISQRADLHAELGEVRAQRHRWKQLGGDATEPTKINDLPRIVADYTTLRRQLAAVALSARRPELETGPEPQIRQRVEELRADKDMLFRMPRLNVHLGNFRSIGLDSFLNEVARLELTAEQTWQAFELVWLRSLDDEFKLRVPEIGQFVAERMSAAANEFRATDIAHRDVTARRVRRAVGGHAKRARDARPDQVRILRQQASRKTRHMAPRRLVEQTSDVLLALSPCWAMSPLVVSRMLPAQRLFDLVIFDEASQIRPHDAITSIMRGSRIVVAGDEKQLPPTDFFQRVLDSDEEDESADDSLSDYESILTALRPLVPISQTLTWHYRSSDERLIAFSNRLIYGDKLVTFPGSNKASPVTLVRVDGRVSPGQDGSAPEEVRKVVDLIIDHASTRQRESLGVIALNVKHQARIERALAQARQQHSEVDEFFSADIDPTRRFFIKNLESVQGDERDAIILSVGIARDAAGRISGNAFGPLNREGTERRINVAVTRATSRMTVVASFSAADLSPGLKNGTKLLREYLEFAEKQGRIEEVGVQREVELNGFEQSIHEALRAQGLAVYPQWGVSDYLIDFALAHSEQPGRMVLAVEADGHRYHSSASARDRDRLRQAHLEKLGWRFHRVWSSAWFSNPIAETDKIVEAWKQAVVDADSDVVPPPLTVEPTQPAAPIRGPRPDIRPGLKIGEYSDHQLATFCRWLMTDGLHLDREDRLVQAMTDLGFSRRGTRIVDRLLQAIDAAQRLTDQEQ